jgi:hypothetical protein
MTTAEDIEFLGDLENHLFPHTVPIKVRAQCRSVVQLDSGFGKPWSSARFHLGVSQGDTLVRDKSLLGLVADWGEYLKGNDEPGVQTTLLRGMRTGRPAGSEQFVETIARLTGRNLGRRKAGRPLERAS